MLLKNQKHLFSIEKGVHYLNCASYSPILKSSAKKGVEAIHKKAAKTYTLKADDHFECANEVRILFAQLTNIIDYQRIAIISSASYGMAIVANNLHRLPNLAQKKYIIQIQDEFPDNIYGFERVAAQHGLSYKTIQKPNTPTQSGKIWNEHILEAINADTAMVVMPHVHWIYGVKFDLETISKRCKEVGALLIIDGSQSIGALPFDVQKIQPDALIAVSYKWLLCTYSLGIAYLGSFFDEGVPVEESWLNRKNSNNFATLIQYERAYLPQAQRYNMGEFSHFIQMPMFKDALQQILNWGVENIQTYCKNITEAGLKKLEQHGFGIEDEDFRAHHLISVGLPPTINAAQLTQQLAINKVIVANRGVGIRISPHLYNTKQDVAALIKILINT